MELNKNSFSASLYRWFYNTDHLPTSLCPYFWKLIVAYVLAAPIGILTLLGVLMYKGVVKLASNIKHNRKKVDQYEHPTESKSNLFVEFIKAKYKKYCPKINWK